MQHKTAIVIGDSSNNTLSVVRALGKKDIAFTLILIGDSDPLYVSKSKYLKRNRLVAIDTLNECGGVLDKLSSGIIICTFDAAAEWIDIREKELSKKFVTPCRGKQIGKLFNKEHQCRLAEECGLTIPRSQLFKRGEPFNSITIDFPLIIKPLYSTGGEKSDIHICKSVRDLHNAMMSDSRCDAFVLQEFIDKEYELDCIGMSCDDKVIVAGAVKKIRHYPDLIGAGAYGIFLPLVYLDIDIDGITEFLKRSNYHGPFSVEFLHHKSKNYFMEVNFRNEGLAQAATDAGANLHATYVTGIPYESNSLRKVYMMNYSIDYLHVKERRISAMRWWRDFIRTRSFINISFSDLKPTLYHYLVKLRRKNYRIR